MNPFLTNNMSKRALFMLGHTEQEVDAAMKEAGIDHPFMLNKTTTVVNTHQKSTVCPCGITRTDCDYHK